MEKIEGLINVASLSNHELFTEVVAAISRCFKSRNKKERPKNWMSISVQIAIATAKGKEGYACADEWVEQFHSLSSTYDAGNNNIDLKFSDALNQLNAVECYRKRLTNVLDHQSSSPTNLSVRQAAGLIRGSVLLSNESKDQDDEAKQIQISIIKLLVETMPQLGTTSPEDIFLAIQLPILQSLDRTVFRSGGISFPSRNAQQLFDYLLDLNLDHSSDATDQVVVGEKRKRNSNENVHDTNLHHHKYKFLIEAAHLARKGAVRAQHGAVIFAPSDTGVLEVIGRGWNHDFLMDRAKTNKNKVVLHSECHAIADAIKNRGEDECFDILFPKSTILIVELDHDFAYDDSHPCPKCDPLLRGVGITDVLHTTADGALTEMKLSAPTGDLLANENCSLPLKAACDEQGITCERLNIAMQEKCLIADLS